MKNKGLATKHMPFLCWATYFGVAALLQLTTGDVPVDFFAFPVNVALAALWVVVLWTLYRNERQSYTVAVMLDVRTTLILTGIFILCCLTAGLTTRHVTVSWWFVASLTALLSHLLLVTIRGLERNRPHRTRFALNHAGLLLLLGGGLFGSADEHEWRAMAAENEQVEKMYDAGGGAMTPERDLWVKGLRTEYYADGVVQNYEADITVDGKWVTLRVNEPYTLSWRDKLYLAGMRDNNDVDGRAHCVLQLVRQPWQRVQWAGVWMLLAGSIMLFVQGTGRKGGREE